MTVENSVHYWAARLKQDGERLDEDRKIAITNNFLTIHVGLAPEKTAIFLDSINELHPDDPEHAFRYATIEAKIADYFNSPKLGEDSQERQKHEVFMQSLREGLGGFYSEDEFRSLAQVAMPGDDHLLLSWLVGSNHPLMRRIRNAYIPGMVDVLEGDMVDGIQDVSYKYFDGEREPVDELEDLIRRMGPDPIE